MSTTHDLISAIYAATLLPEDFNRKFDDLDTLLFDAADRQDQRSPGTLEASTFAHIENARSIQDRIGRARSREQQIESILESVPNPSYLINQRGAVTALNAMAMTRHGPRPTTLDDCIADDAARRRVSEFLARDKSGRLLAVAGHAQHRNGTSSTSVLLKRVDPGLLTGESDQLFLLSIVDLGFDEDAIDLFRQAFDLTEAESRVAVLLASGLRLPDIAAERQVSIDTVRTQVKTIKSKTSVPDIPALVRLMYGFNAGALAPTTSRSNSAARHRSGPLRLRQQVTLPGGRKLEYLEQGAPDGEPVLLFHNLPYGAELPAAAISEAHARGVRVIAPFRPGFGGSDMVSERGDDLLTRAARDAAELLRQLGIRKVAVVSHAAGAPFALRFASVYPQMVSRLVGASRAPAWRDEWMGLTPQRQRFMLRLSKYAPQLLPVVAWAMVAVMESNRAAEFVRYCCKDGEADARAAENPETVDLIAGGSVEALRNGLEGLCHELEIAMLDLSEEARSVEHKFHFLHGRDDRIVDLSQTQAFAREVPGTVVEVIDGAGQLLFFSHWRRVLDAVVPGRVAAGERAAEPVR